MLGITNAVTKGIGGIKIVNISIVNPPNKTSYLVGDTFDPTGAVVIARYSNDSTKDVSTLCSWSPLVLNANTRTVLCSYLEYGEEITVELPITVQRLKINTIPSQDGELTYNGNTQFPSWLNYDSNQLTIGGITSNKNAGTFNVIFTPKEKYEWYDGTTDAKTVSWTINRAAISTIPSPSGKLTYNGSTQSPIWFDWDATQLTVSNNSGINAGTYIAIFTPTANYQWSDGSISGKNVTWIIDAIAISLIPSQSNQLSYTGSAQSPTWSNFNTEQLTLEGTTSSVNAGNFTVTFTPKTNYKWSDGSASKSVTWSIAKLAGSISLSSSAQTITTSTTITYTKVGDGTVTTASNNSSIATASISGTNITITGVGGGTAVITVTLNEGTNYTGASATCSITVQKDFKYTFSPAGNASFSGSTSGDWMLTIKNTGTLTIQDLGAAASTGLDIFLAGGGGSGGSRYSGSTTWGQGGSGGYNKTVTKNKSLQAGGTYTCTIGAGGKGVTGPDGDSKDGNPGGATSISGTSLTVSGGEGGARKAGLGVAGTSRQVTAFDGKVYCKAGAGADWDEATINGAANTGNGGNGHSGGLSGSGGSGIILIRNAR